MPPCEILIAGWKDEIFRTWKLAPRMGRLHETGDGFFINETIDGVIFRVVRMFGTHAWQGAEWESLHDFRDNLVGILG